MGQREAGARSEVGSVASFLPFLGDEITGKTIAIIGTGRIGLAMIKKCIGFDMNVLCYDPVFQNQQFVADPCKCYGHAAQHWPGEGK